MKNINNKTQDLTARFRKTKTKRSRYWAGSISINDFVGFFPIYPCHFAQKTQSAIAFSKNLYIKQQQL